MSDTRIDWAERVWNPTAGCTHVSAGCDNCYAAAFAHRGLTESHRGLTTMVKRHGKALPQWNGTVRLLEDKLGEPLKWRRWAARFPWFRDESDRMHGRRPRVFVNSMSDLFHKEVPDVFVDRVLAVVALCPDIEFVVLTKRPERMAEYLSRGLTARNIGLESLGHALHAAWLNEKTSVGKGITLDSACSVSWPMPNLTLGISAENQKALDDRLPHLLRCRSARRIVSYEPALGPIDFGECEAWLTPDTGALQQGSSPRLDIHGVICGGESGPRARPTDFEWHRSVRDQCRAAGVAFWYKQMGRRVIDPDGYIVTLAHEGRNRDEMPEDLDIREWAK